jgi:hypothetical protein
MSAWTAHALILGLASALLWLFSFELRFFVHRDGISLPKAIFRSFVPFGFWGRYSAGYLKIDFWRYLRDKGLIVEFCLAVVWFAIMGAAFSAFVGKLLAARGMLTAG